MMTNYYEKVKLFIDMNPHLTIPQTPATDEMITHIEETLNLTLKGEYLQLIRHWGTLLLYCSRNDRYHGIYRFNDGNSVRLIYSVIDYTMSCRKTGIDHHFIAFVSIEGDEYLVLNPQIDGDQEVFRWNYFEQKFEGKISESLFQLIWQDIEECVIPFAKKDGKPVNLEGL